MGFFVCFFVVVLDFILFYFRIYFIFWVVVFLGVFGFLKYFFIHDIHNFNTSTDFHVHFTKVKILF